MDVGESGHSGCDAPSRDPVDLAGLLSSAGHMLGLTSRTPDRWPPRSTSCSRRDLARPMVAADSKSGATFERVVIDGEPLRPEARRLGADWIARALGDLGPGPSSSGNRACSTRLPTAIDHTYAGAAPGITGCGADARRRAWLVPEGTTPIPEADHLAFLDQLAALHARFWELDRRRGARPAREPLLHVQPVDDRGARRHGGSRRRYRSIARDGWFRLRPSSRRRCTRTSSRSRSTPRHSSPRSTPRRTRSCTAMKLGNLGRQPDGRTILIDWAVPGRAVGCMELAYYLALNRARIPPAFTPEDDHRRVPRRARTARDRHRPVVGPSAPAGAARDHGAARLGEGARPARRPRLVGGR